MKQIWKYLNGLWFLLALGIHFAGLIEIATVKISAVDLVKLSFGKPAGLDFLAELYGPIQSNIAPLGIGVIVLMVILVVGLVLTLLLKKAGSHITAMIFAILHALGVGIFYFILWAAVESIQDALNYFYMGGMIGLHRAPLFMWMLLDVAIIVCAIVGLVSGDGSKKRAPMPQQMPPQYRGNVGPGYPQQAPRSYAQPQQPVQQQPQQPVQQPQQPVRQQTASQVQAHQMNPQPVEPEGTFELDNDLVKICYDAVEHRFCVEPKEKLSVFLMSGQPLGANRQYYLEKGTKIYLKNKENNYTLV